jgi:RNA polymerase sigma-70 factor (ECF subfamily)
MRSTGLRSGVNVLPAVIVSWGVEGDRGATWTSARPTPIAAVVTSRRDAFASLMERHLDAAYRLAAVILGDATEAEDAVHDAAVAAWRSRELLRDVGRFEAWFTRIVVNACRDRLRARSRHRVVQLSADFADADSSHTGSDDLEVFATRDAIGRGFAVLEPDERIVLVLRFWQDLSVDSIAERTGVPSGTVKSRMHHALGRLRTALAVDEVAR